MEFRIPKNVHQAWCQNVIIIRDYFHQRKNGNFRSENKETNFNNLIWISCSSSLIHISHIEFCCKTIQGDQYMLFSIILPSAKSCMCLSFVLKLFYPIYIVPHLPEEVHILNLSTPIRDCSMETLAYREE